MRSLYPYQKKAVKQLRRNPEGGALLMEPGLGKSTTALHAWGGNGNLIVVAPVSALGVWHAELAVVGHHAPYLPKSGAAKAKFLREEKPQIVVINYEALLNAETLRALWGLSPYTLILDESQRIKTPTAKRTKAALALSTGHTTYILSGTPITRSMLDLYSQYKTIDPWIWDNQSFSRFKQKYAIMGGYGGYQVVGYRNVQDLETRIQPYTFALRKEDALSLPPQTDQVLPILSEPEFWKDYRKLANGGLWKGKPVDNPLTRALRLQQLVGSEKVKYTVEVVRDLIEAGEPTVVFYRFLDEGMRLSDTLYNTVPIHEINGMVEAEQRTRAVEAFQNGAPSALLAQIDSGAVAITLTASSNVVYHSMSWNYESAVQSRDRVHRIGQTKPVTYRYVQLVGPAGQESIDSLIHKALLRKGDIAAMIMENPKLLEV